MKKILLSTLGTPVSKEELLDIQDSWPRYDGSVQLIYGRIRQGKTTEAVRRIISSLSQGRPVYTNILLDLSQWTFDERASVWVMGRNLFFWRKRVFVFDIKNYHYFNPTSGECDFIKVFNPLKEGDEVRWLNSLLDCDIYYDEGHWLLDSYDGTRVSMDKRRFITEGGHCGRVFVVISQRTQSIHVNARGNVNQFFRCSRRALPFFSLLRVDEYQEMSGNDVDETVDPVSKTLYMANKRYWRLFNTYYLREGRPKSQDVYFSAYDLKFYERFLAFLSNLPVLRRLLRDGAKGAEGT